MKITVVSLWAQKLFDPDEPQPFGGAELQLVLLSRELVKHPDVTIQFVTRGQGPFRVFESDGIRVHKLPHRNSRWTRSALGSMDLLRTLHSLETDIFIQRGGGIETGITGRAASHNKKPFLFMTSHDWDVDRTHEKKRGFVYGKSYMHGLNRSAAIITQSQYQHDRLQANYGRDSTILRSSHVIPPDVPEEKNGVLWVGRCEPWKQPDTFLRLAEHLPDVPFTMVCPSANSSDMFSTITARAERLANVDFRPGVSFEETERLFARHSIFVNTSEREGFPNTFVQACKWGTPIVSLCVNPDDLLTEHDFGRCADGNEEALAPLVQKLLDDRPAWKHLATHARVFAQTHHNVKVNSKKLHSILASLMKRP